MKRLLTIPLFLLIGALMGLTTKPTRTALPYLSHTIDDIIPGEYWCGYHTTDGHLWAINYGGGITDLTSALPGGLTITKAAMCFNLFRVIASDGTIWQSTQYNQSLSWSQITTDSTGATITNAMWIDGYQDTYAFLRTDSSLWYGGNDNPGIFYTAGSQFMRPTAMAPGVKFQKVKVSQYGVLAETSDSTKLYYWAAGAGATQTAIYNFSGKGTGKVTWFDLSNGNPFSYVIFAVVQQSAGSPYGHPYAMGNDWSKWGAASAQSFSSFTDLYTQWGLTSPVREICVNFQTTVFNDSAQNMYATGMNVQGEVGIGSEAVNSYYYVNYPTGFYGWDGVGGEYPVTGMHQIGIGVHWVHIFSNKFFTYYHGASDINDSLYFWGRNKTEVQPFGLAMNVSYNDSVPNALDVLSPTMGSPFAINSTKSLRWVRPAPSAGSNQTINTTSTTLTAGGHSALLINVANSTDTVKYPYASYAWSYESGPAGITPTIVSPSSKSTSVNGMTANGVYIFKMVETNSNAGQDTANVKITVNNIACNCIVFPQKITLH